MRRWAVIVPLFVAVVFALVYAALSIYMAETLTRPSRSAFSHAPEQYGLTYEIVRFPSRVDAVPLEGWLMPSGSGRPVVVVHGRGGDRQAGMAGRMLEVYAGLVRQGHSVLAFDLRGSGRSGGARFTLGAQEVRDVGGAIDFLGSRGLAPSGVDLLGYSMGAATALLVAPGEAAVHAVVDDSGYADLGDVLASEVPKRSGLPRIFTPGVIVAAWPLAGAYAYDIRPINGMPTLAARGVPLLVIHGEADALVPVEHGRRLAAAYGPKARTWFVPGAAHTESYLADPTRYLSIVEELLGQKPG